MSYTPGVLVQGDHLPVLPHDPRDLRAWLHKADEDLAAAEQLLATDSFMVRSAVAFHAQQCVEKVLKALLVARGVDFDRSHDLGYLLHRLEGHGGIPRPVAGSEAGVRPHAEHRPRDLQRI